MAGSGRLYRTGAPTGKFGLADPSFEKKYLAPIAEEFGDLEKSGISFLGLMTPEELRELYSRSALGFINFNWHSFTETFCCVGAEMLATELPIFSYSTSALPETMGRTGGAILHNTPSISEGAEVVANLLTHPALLASLGKRGRNFVTQTYCLESITDTWEQILHAEPDRLDILSGKWNYRRNFRYWLEKAAGMTGLGKLYRTAIDRLK